MSDRKDRDSLYFSQILRNLPQFRCGDETGHFSLKFKSWNLMCLCGWVFYLQPNCHTVCPRSLVRFPAASCYIKWGRFFGHTVVENFIYMKTKIRVFLFPLIESLSLCLFVSLSLCLFVSLSASLCLSLSVCLSVWVWRGICENLEDYLKLNSGLIFILSEQGEIYWSSLVLSYRPQAVLNRSIR